jgi:DNA-directed RNA polymerase specialized sigma24 family protein
MVSTRALSGFAPRIPWCVLEELAQEATLRTLTRAADNPRAFARRTAHNLAIDWLRRHRDEPLDDDQGAPDPWKASDARLDVETLLAAAPARHRTLVARLYLHGEALEDLIEEEVGGSREDVAEAEWARARDVLYKRRRRSLAWLAKQMAAGPMDRVKGWDGAGTPKASPRRG